MAEYEVQNAVWAPYARAAIDMSCFMALDAFVAKPPMHHTAEVLGYLALGVGVKAADRAVNLSVQAAKVGGVLAACTAFEATALATSAIPGMRPMLERIVAKSSPDADELKRMYPTRAELEELAKQPSERPLKLVPAPTDMPIEYENDESSRRSAGVRARTSHLDRILTGN